MKVAAWQHPLKSLQFGLQILPFICKYRVYLYRIYIYICIYVYIYIYINQGGKSCLCIFIFIHTQAYILHTDLCKYVKIILEA